MLNRTIGVVLGLCFAVGLTSLYAQPHQRTVRDTVSLSPGSVSVENEEGSITVSTWSRDAVAYEARIESEQDKAFVENTVIDVETLTQHLELESNFDDLEAQWSFGPEIYGYGVSHPAVHYTLTVPESAEVSVAGEDAEIDVTGLRAPLQVETDEGPVRVANQRGATRIDADDGSVTVADVRGDLAIDMDEGTATVNELRGRFLLGMEEGQADVTVDSLEGAQIDTDEARVTLSVPAGDGFDLSTDLGDDAELTGNFEFASLQDEEENYHGALRGGGPLLRLASREGNITLRSQ